MTFKWYLGAFIGLISLSSAMPSKASYIEYGSQSPSAHNVQESKELHPFNPARNSDGTQTAPEKHVGPPRIFSVASASEPQANLAAAARSSSSNGALAMMIYVLGALMLSLVTLSRDRKTPSVKSH